MLSAWLGPPVMCSLQGGGVLDPNSGLKITDFAGAIGADKLMSTMAIAPETKRKNKRKGKGEEEQRKSDDDVKEAFIHFIHTETVSKPVNVSTVSTHVKQ